MRNEMRENRAKLTEDIIQEAEFKRKKMVESLVSKWSKNDTRVGSGFGRLSEREQELTAVLCENQMNHMKALKEYQVSSTFGLTPEKVLEVIRLSAPNSNLGNIFREIPMLSTDDSFYFVDAVYATNKTRASAVAGNKYYESMDAYYASEKMYQVVGTGDGTTTTFTYTLPTVPVRPYSIIFSVAGAYVGNDNGSGLIVSSLLSASSVNYTTGAVSVTFVTAPATGTEIAVEYNWDSEVSTNFNEFGELNLNVRKFKFNAVPSPLGFSYNKLAELVLGTTGLGDAKEILMKSVSEELLKARDYRALKLGKRVAKSNTGITYNADFASAGAENEIDHAQTITAYIEKMGNSIFNDVKRGTVSKIVAGPGAVTYMKYHRTWEDDSSQPRIGVHLVGKINGIEVFKSPADSTMVDNNEVMGVWKNENNEGDSSIVFGTLIPLFDAGTLSYPQQFRTEGALAHYGDQAIVNPKFIRLMTMSNLAY